VTVGLTTLADPATPDIHTGVTAILPRPAEDLLSPLWGGAFAMNGNGEMTGVHWLHEAGWFTGPITLTNSLSLGRAHHGTIRWMIDHFGAHLDDNGLWLLPVAAETYDGWLNDIYGQHVSEQHVVAAIDGAQSGPVAEGSVGGGTGMIAYEYKGGTGTSSRQVALDGETFTLGVLVQANHGLRPWLTVCGKAVGKDLPGSAPWTQERGSIIAVIATDAPLLPIQLQRLARRAGIGIGRGGTPSGNNSGDIFLAFSTANALGPLPEPARMTLSALSNDLLDPLFMAVVEAVDEAVLNAMLAAEPCTGRKGRFVDALDGPYLASLFASEAV
jgi:L-aminopeptidase/D-esterase-like protein